MPKVSKVPRFSKKFQDFIDDENNWLALEHVDQLVNRGSLFLDQSKVIAVLKAHFDEIFNLRKEKRIAFRDLKFEDMKNIDALLSQYKSVRKDFSFTGDIDSYYDEKHPDYKINLAHRIFLTMDEVELASNCDKQLYATKENPLDSIKADAILQGSAGNCMFLAALASIVRYHPEIILNMIEDLENGSFKVSFAGERNHPVVIEKPTTVELAIFARVSEYGIWPSVIEKAWGARMKSLAFEPSSVDQSNTEDAEYWSEVYRVLTGQESKLAWFEECQQSSIKRILDENSKDNRALTAWAINESGKSQKSNQIRSNHAYSIIDWDNESSIVTLRNPWGDIYGSEPMDDNGNAKDGKLDGIFKLSFSEFHKTFSAIHYEGKFKQEFNYDSNSEAKFEASKKASSTFTIWTYRLWATVAFSLGGFLLLLCLAQLNLEYESISWPKTQGMIIENILPKASENKNSKPDPTITNVDLIKYKFEVNNQPVIEEFEYTPLQKLFKEDKKYEAGQLVEVAYHPKYPDKYSSLNPGFHISSTPLLVLLSIGSSIFMIWCIGMIIYAKYARIF